LEQRPNAAMWFKFIRANKNKQVQSDAQEYGNAEYLPS